MSRFSIVPRFNRKLFDWFGGFFTGCSNLTALTTAIASQTTFAYSTGSHFNLRGDWNKIKHIHAYLLFTQPVLAVMSAWRWFYNHCNHPGRWIDIHLCNFRNNLHQEWLWGKRDRQEKFPSHFGFYG